MWCKFSNKCITIQCKFSNKYITNLMQVFKQICQINANFKAAWAEGGWSRTWNSRIKENRANSLGKWHGKDMMLTSIGTCKLLRSGWSEAVGSQPLGKVNFHGHLRHHLSHHMIINIVIIFKILNRPGIWSMRSSRAFHSFCSGAFARRLWTWFMAWIFMTMT